MADAPDMDDPAQQQARLEKRYARSIADASRPAPVRPAPDALPVHQHGGAPESSEQAKLEKRYSKSPRPDSDEPVEGNVPSPDHARAAELQRQWQEQLRADPELAGDYDANLEVARSAVREFGDRDLQDLLDGPLGDHPALVRFARRVGQRLAQQRTAAVDDTAAEQQLKRRYSKTLNQRGTNG